MVENVSYVFVFVVSGIESFTSHFVIFVFVFFRYQDPDNSKFGCLRVLNEDRITPGSGFPLHTHREFEIFSYIISGSLEQLSFLIFHSILFGS